MLRAFLSILFVVGLFLGTAAAQAPESSVAVTAPASVELKPGESKDMMMKVQLRVANIVCHSNAVIKVDITGHDTTSENPMVMFHLSKSFIEFTIMAGPYQNETPQGANPYVSPLTDHHFMVMLADKAPQGENHTFEIKASLSAGMPSNCQGSANIPAATDTVDHVVRILSLPKPPAVNNTSAAPPPPPAVEPKGAPGVSAFALVLAVSAALVLRYRRQ